MNNHPSHSHAATNTLVIYYSFEGNTQLMAESMAQATHADILPITPEKEMTSKGFSKYIWGGSQVVMKQKPAILPLQVDLKEYDLLLLGTPVWAWTYAPPIATLLHTTDFSHKAVGLFACHGGQLGKTFFHLKKQLVNSRILGEIDFFEPASNHREASIQRAKEWAVRMKQVSI